MLVIQLTGLSGAGKTTLSHYVKQELESKKFRVEIIDGDTCRKTLCKDLGFSHADRIENIRRLGQLAYQHAAQGTIAIIAAINPFEAGRQELKAKYNAKTIWIDCALDTLINRDTKGLYKRALLPDGHSGKLFNLTGVNDVYEKPLNPDLHICTHLLSTEAAVLQISGFILAAPELTAALRAGYTG